MRAGPAFGCEGELGSCVAVFLSLEFLRDITEDMASPSVGPGCRIRITNPTRRMPAADRCIKVGRMIGINLETDSGRTRCHLDKWHRVMRWLHERRWVGDEAGHTARVER